MASSMFSARARGFKLDGFWKTLLRFANSAQTRKVSSDVANRTYHISSAVLWKRALAICVNRGSGSVAPDFTVTTSPFSSIRRSPNRFGVAGLLKS